MRTWKNRLAGPVMCLVMLLVAAFSTGSVLFLTASALLFLCMVAAWLSVLMASGTLEITGKMDCQTVQRGDTAMLKMQARCRAILPVTPVVMDVADARGEVQQIRLHDLKGHVTDFELPFHAAHVGVAHPGVMSATVSDLFGLFTVTVRPQDASSELLVLPATFELDKLKYAPGDSGLETMARATEDVNNPADVRGYQPGDAMKKIHWKLSLRKGELMVRRFEEPVLADALVLMDCSSPPEIGHPEAEADMRDALLETAASVMEQAARTDHGARLPLLGEHPVELDKGMGMPLILEHLSRMDFTETDKFERVLLLETRRMRKVGATAVISARLNSRMVDVMIRMRKMGPYVRLYLVTFTPDDPAMLPLISKLQRGMVEVCYVTPMPA